MNKYEKNTDWENDISHRRIIPVGLRDMIEERRARRGSATAADNGSQQSREQQALPVGSPNRNDRAPGRATNQRSGVGATERNST